MSNNELKLNMLAMRALEEMQLNMSEFNCTLAMILQEKLQSPEEPVRDVLKRSYEAEEPLAWDGIVIPELKVMVLNDKCNKQLHYIDKLTGTSFLSSQKRSLAYEQKRAKVPVEGNRYFKERADKNSQFLGKILVF